VSLPLCFLTAVAEAAPANPVSLHPWTFVFQVLNVLVVIGGLTFLLFRPLGALMKKREDHIEESLAQAGQARQEAGALRAEYQQKIRSVREEAQEILDQAAKDAQEYERVRKEETDVVYAQMLAEAKREIEDSRQAVLASMHEEVATMAVMAASQVLGRAISDEEHREILRDFIEKVMELPQVVKELAHAAEDGRDILRVELITAVPLPDDLCQSLRQRLSQVGKKKEVRLVLRQDPDLVGGARLRIDGVLVDDSIGGRLRRLERFVMEDGSQTEH
jgi:F-type H+-transporting ATPase subunit b